LGRAAADGRNAVAVAAILADNGMRIQTRIQRFEDGRPSVPNVVWVLLLVTIAVTIGGLAALVHPGVRAAVQIGVLAGTTLVFGLSLLVVQDSTIPIAVPPGWSRRRCSTPSAGSPRCPWSRCCHPAIPRAVPPNPVLSAKRFSSAAGPGRAVDGPTVVAGAVVTECTSAGLASNAFLTLRAIRGPGAMVRLTGLKEDQRDG
jgi:hypothetical protein